MQEAQRKSSDRLVSPKDHVVQVARASIPCNPNTIYNVGNMRNPVYLLQEKTNTEDVISSQDLLRVPSHERSQMERAGANPRTAFEYFKSIIDQQKMLQKS